MDAVGGTPDVKHT